MSVKSRAGYYKLIDKQKLEQFVFPSARPSKEDKRSRILTEEKANPEVRYFQRQLKI